MAPSPMQTEGQCQQRQPPPPGFMVGRSIDSGNLQFTRLIGIGTYGEVYHAVDRRSGESYAVKVLPRKHSQLQGGGRPHDEPFMDARLLSREVALYARIPRHDNIVHFERMLHTQDQLFMVMEYCSGGDLYENISKNPYFRLPGNDALIRRLFLQLASAIAHCHNNGVYHRDIKPENVLVSRDGLNVKLIDFGLATSDQWCREIGCGSAYYMSPECQGGICTPVDRYASAPNDVWALGVILVNLTTGRNPWNRAHINDPLFRRFLSDKSFLCQAIRATPEFAHVIHRVLDPNPDTRCTLDELQQLVKRCPRFLEPHAEPHAAQTHRHNRHQLQHSHQHHQNHHQLKQQVLFLGGTTSPATTPSVDRQPAAAPAPAPAPAGSKVRVSGGRRYTGEAHQQQQHQQQHQHHRQQHTGQTSPCKPSSDAVKEQLAYAPLGISGLGAEASSRVLASAFCGSVLLGRCDGLVTPPCGPLCAAMDN